MMRLLQAAASTAILISAAAAHAQTSADAPREGIAYASAAQAYQALRAKAGVTFSKNDDWTIARDTDGALWSFTPETHYAHPSVGRRRLLAHEGRYYVQTQILCQAQKSACDRLHADYQLLDRRMTEAIRTGK